MKLIILCLLMVSSTVFAATNQMKWCAFSTHEQEKCTAMREAFAAQGLSPALVCVQGDDIEDCMEKIQAGQADLFTLDGGDVYVAGKEFNLVPIIQEKYVKDTYRGIAVVRATDSTLSFRTLKGKKSCHTGVRRTAGWNIPVGFLLANDYMDPVDCGDDINAVANYFSESCAPGAYSERNDPYGTNPANLCAICNNTRCPPDSSEPYQSYAGAFRCLAEGAGDVAFIKPATVQENTDGNGDQAWNRDLLSTNFRILCPDNTQSTVDDYENCNLAKSPAHAVVTSPNTPQEDIVAFQQVLERAVALFGADNNTNGFKMFDSAKFNGRDLLFKDSTQDLINLAQGLTYRTYLGDYADTIEGLKKCPDGTLRWCTTSASETRKCRDMKAAFEGANLTPVLSCYEEQTAGHCIDRIVGGDADVVTLDGGDLYKGGDRIVPVAGESYNVGNEDPDASYWAVAVVNRGGEWGMDDLKGRKSCHTGIGKTSGWNVPVGHLIKQNQITVEDNCDIPEAVGEFFSSSCAPGAKTAKYDPDNSNPTSLCQLCIGEATNHCVRNSNEPYYDYAGAFRCLAEGAGNVAFVKHATVPDNTNGRNTEAWAATLRSEDFQLLCANNSRADVTDYKTCNLAKVPSHAVVTAATKTAAEREEILNLLLEGQRRFGSDQGSNFKMFDSSAYDDSDLLFKDSTVQLVDVGDQDTTYEWLSEEYKDDLDALQCDTGAASHILPTSMLILLLASFAQIAWSQALTWE